MRDFVLILWILSIAFCNSALAQQEENFPASGPLKVTRLKGPIVFDGIPDEEAWQSVPALPLSMYMPVPGNDPTQHSVVKIAYDDDYLYVSGVIYYSDKSRLRAIGKQRNYDDGISSSGLSFVLDTFNDRENAVFFGTNPNGQRTDASIKNDCEDEDNDFNTSWNTFWDVEAVITEQGWSAEFRIPFSSLRFQSIEGKTLMGITIMRWSPGLPELATFPKISPKLSNSYWRPSQTATIEFEGLQSTRPLYITPYLIGGVGQLNELNVPGTAYEMSSTPKYDAGLDLKYGISNNLTLDVTVNTDFAQIEADDQMINLTRYSLFFPEKRVFFLEKTDAFDFSFLEGNNLFYSRRIGIHGDQSVRIYGGARMTGRVDNWDIGVLSIQTEAFMDNPGENFGAMRLKRSVLNPYSYVGGMATSRLGIDGAYNVAYGLDGHFRITGDEYLTFRMAQTVEDNVNNMPLQLEPTRMLFRWQRRSRVGLGYDFIYTYSGTQYNPGIGFERKKNYHGPSGEISYRWWPGESSILLDHGLTLEAYNYRNTLTGLNETVHMCVTWAYRMKSMYGGRIKANLFVEDLADRLILGRNQAEVPPGRYSFVNFSPVFYTSWARNLSAQFASVAGNFYDGWRFSFYVEPRLKIGSDFDLGVTYYLDHVDFPGRETGFTNHIFGFRGLMTLTTRTSLSSFVQYNTAIERVIANVRFRYNPREGNDFYVVYDEGMNTNIHRATPILPYSRGRTILLKYTYTFLL